MKQAMLSRTFRTLTAALIFGITLSGAHTMTHAAPQDPTAPVATISEWNKILPRSDKVSHRKASFKNRYGITLVGDLYVPKEASGKLPAIAWVGPIRRGEGTVFHGL